MYACFYYVNKCATVDINAKLINDISPERIYTELELILTADEKQGVCYGHYNALKILDTIGVFDEILPELTLGRNMSQRADFHKYDVLEHSLRANMYATKEIRLAALLHDVGKPYCFLKDGNSYDHPQEGARIAGDILTRLKAPKKTIAKTQILIAYHMYDFDLKTKESKLRRFIVENYSIFNDLLGVKQADYSGCMDDLSLCPTAKKWLALEKKMQAENVPFSLKQLAINGRELSKNGYPDPVLAQLLKRLLLHVATLPSDNEKSRLLLLAKGFFNDLTKENKK